MKIVLYSLIFINTISCCKIFQDDELTVQRTSYVGNELRIDGYYYWNYQDDNMNIYYFFANGIIRYGGGGSTSFLEFENKVRNNNIVDINSKTTCGVFLINGDSIKFEKWYPSNGEGLPVYIREGKILNDTTFHITLAYRSDGSEKSIKNEMYHFRQFSIKPDSISPFIK